MLWDFLLWNERHELTEGTIANVAVLRDTPTGLVWITPHVGCGLLAGVMRESLLAQDQLQEGTVSLSEVIECSRFPGFNFHVNCAKATKVLQQRPQGVLCKSRTVRKIFHISQHRGENMQPVERSLRDHDHLGKEDDDGRTEYKWKLVGITDERFEHLVTQMKYRLSEGQGECVYEIGVLDCGLPRGVTEAEFRESIDTLRRMAGRLQAELTIACEKVVQEEPEVLKCAEILVRKYAYEEVIDIRLALCGAVGSGKSTLVGVLTRGVLDNGHGSARQNVFNHLHEIESGLTSSISQQTVGFDASGKLVSYVMDELGPITSDQIAEMSTKLFTLFDLAGHEKYLKTTVAGMTGAAPHYACVVIAADRGLERMTKEHIGLCVALKIPFFVVVTRCDVVTEANHRACLAAIRDLLASPGVCKVAYPVENENDVWICIRNMKGGQTAPIFSVSNKTGQDLTLVQKFLNLLPARKDWEALASQPTEVVIAKIYPQVAASGTVASGVVQQGVVCLGDSLLLGPDEDGEYHPVQVSSMHVKRMNVKKAEAGLHASFALQHADSVQVKKGMVLLDPKTKPAAFWQFEADVKIEFTANVVETNFQPVVHCHMMRQNARIVLPPSCPGLQTGDTARVTFEFLYQPEFLKSQMPIVFIEGSTRGFGTIVQVLPGEGRAPPKRRAKTTEPDSNPEVLLHSPEATELSSRGSRSGRKKPQEEEFNLYAD
eukprot:TRINITY_DN5464_c0_g1_i1.p1 TRINITY_DN5464_c0_g1~~TRINITY_DN5464_c0_g1_i1.p1  ORF type:complete len:716 (+),score=88.89 TRINITY_DN5464_c0_g1_i1:435-2582(+)